VSNAPSKPVSFSRPKVGYFSNRPRIYVRVKKQSCPCAGHKAIQRSGGVGPRILNLVSIRRMVISFTLRPFHNPQNSPLLGIGRNWTETGWASEYVYTSDRREKHSACARTGHDSSVSSPQPRHYTN